MTVNIQDNRLPDNLLIAGRSGSGKSYYFEHTILPELLKDSRPMIILDYKDQYQIGSKVHLSQLDGPQMLGDIMQGLYSNGRKPRVLRIISRNYDPVKIDNIIFQYLNNSKPKIFVMEEGAFFFEDLVRREVPEHTKSYFRTSIGAHNLGQNCVIISQFTRDVPSKVLNCFADGRLFYLPMRELQYLHDIRYLEEDPEYIHSIVAPFKSYKWYDVGAYLRGKPQPCETNSYETASVGFEDDDGDDDRDTSFRPSKSPLLEGDTLAKSPGTIGK
jgi:hypothetical protein